MSLARRQVLRFLIVGGSNVGVDLLVYSVLITLALQVDAAKAASFLTGTAFAYFANRLWTFSAAGSAQRFAGFVSLYLATLVVNVGANSLVLQLFAHEQIGYVMGYLVATGLSASLNFLGMKYLVFVDTDDDRLKPE